MIIPNLHRQPVPLDSAQHRQTRVRLPVTDWSHVAGMNGLFLTAAECLHMAADYPIVFVKTGQDEKGQVDYAPIAVLGMTNNQNLYLNGGTWRATQLPAMMASYPFCVARAPGDRYAVCIDGAYSGLATAGEGDRLFTDDGQPAEFAKTVQAELERLESLINATRVISRRLSALGLLQEKRFDATLPNGEKLAVDGFYTIDEAAVKALPDATVLELHRDGLLSLINAHWVSLGQMRRLLQWHAESVAATATAAAAKG